MSSARFNGADLGIRQALLPLFDRFGVDLVVAGHEHHYERAHPVRGAHHAGGLLTPRVASSSNGAIDTSKGRVHLTIGVGGSPNPSLVESFTDPPQGLVICGIGPNVPGRQRAAHRETEPAEWLAARAIQYPYGYTVFDVDPGPAYGTTRIHVTHMGARARSTRYRIVDQFTLERPRRDASPMDWPSLNLRAP